MRFSCDLNREISPAARNSCCGLIPDRLVCFFLVCIRFDAIRVRAAGRWCLCAARARPLSGACAVVNAINKYVLQCAAAGCFSPGLCDFKESAMKSLAQRVARAAIACAAGAAWLFAGATAVTLSSVAAAQDARGDRETIGIPTTGAMGITETVAEIMARAALNPPMWDRSRPPIEAGPENEADDKIDFTRIPQRPGAELVPYWPFPAPNQRTPMGGIVFDPNNPGGGGAPFLPQAVGTNFTAFTINNSGFIPPDSEGAVGPTQIVAIANGIVRTFNKSSGAADGALNATTNTFFQSVVNNSTISDPRARFDRLTNRWFIIAINVTRPNRVVLAVSSGATITNTSSFTFFQFTQDTIGVPGADDNALFDYPSLGIDANGIYTGGNMFTTGFVGPTVFVIRKSSVLGAGPIVVSAFRNLSGSGDGPFAPMGVDNDDPAPPNGYVIGASQATFGRLILRRVSNAATTPTMSANIVINTVATGQPIAVPALGSTNPLSAVDYRLMGAKICFDQINNRRNIWTAQHIQVNASGVADSFGGRNGVRWYEVQNLEAAASVRQAGTLFDSAATNPRSFWMGSIATSRQGHSAIGSTFAGLADRAGVATAGRLRTDTTGSLQAATIAVAGGGSYNVENNVQRWGDYSHTVVDPSDGMTMWTFQEFCDVNNSWAVRVTQLRAPPPATPSSASPANVNQGFTGNIVITGASTAGSEFFDPGTGFTGRIAAIVNGGGVTINSITFTNPTSITLNVTVAGNAGPGSRTVTVTNPDGQQRTSAAGIITITGQTTCPSITGNPTNTQACVGGSAQFTASATGVPDPSFQWRRNGVNVPGATSATLVINPVAVASAGSYDCVATNSCGSATTTAATLTVLQSPIVTTPPQPTSGCVGGIASMTVILADATGCTFQWQRNGINVSGATNQTLTFNPLTAFNAGNYRCVITNPCGSITSPQALLTVLSPPSITGQPQSATRCETQSVSFTVTSTPAGATFQWQKNTVNIPGATASTFTINSVSINDAGNYRCVVTNGCGSTNSNEAALTVSTTPQFSTQPQDATRCTGQDVTFTVAVSNPSGATYQWQKNGTDIPGATSPSFAINPIGTLDGGLYRCRVENACGIGFSNSATLTVNSTISFLQEPQDATRCAGQSVDFSVVLENPTGATYQWQKNSIDIPGATNSSFSINPVAAGDAGQYRCVVTTPCGTQATRNATLSVSGSLQFTQQPQDTSACVGQLASFTIAVDNPSGVTYQWQKDSVDIPGATAITYAIPSVSSGDAGLYRCVATSSCGNSISNAATLSVLVGPSITDQPDAASVTVGDPISLSVTAAGSTPITYQWRKNTANIPGATNDTFSIPAAALADAGSYDCVVTNSCGTTTSQAAPVDVFCLADFNRDGAVDFFDYLDFVSAFDAENPNADINDDGAVDFFDYLDFVSAFDLGC
jgi:hypothetical protein